MEIEKGGRGGGLQEDEKNSLRNHVEKSKRNKRSRRSLGEKRGQKGGLVRERVLHHEKGGTEGVGTRRARFGSDVGRRIQAKGWGSFGRKRGT